MPYPLIYRNGMAFEKRELRGLARGYQGNIDPLTGQIITEANHGSKSVSR